MCDQEECCDNEDDPHPPLPAFSCHPRRVLCQEQPQIQSPCNKSDPKLHQTPVSGLQRRCPHVRGDQLCSDPGPALGGAGDPPWQRRGQPHQPQDQHQLHSQVEDRHQGVL